MGDEKKWKRRLPTRIYNYNYKVSEGYYKPQTDYLETKEFSSRNRYSPPQHQSYAERFANNPWYGDTKGLPYHDTDSAGPLIKLGDRHMRSSSLLREMKELEEEGIPLNVRASRRKKRFEEEEERLGIRPRITRTTSLESPITDSISRDRKSKDFQMQVKQKIQNLDDELRRSTATTVDRPTKWNYDLDRPGKKVRHIEESYSPHPGSTVKRTYHTEHSSSSSSTKPPVVPLRSRKISGSDDIIKPRMRVNSEGDFSAMPRLSRRTSETTEEEIPLYSNRAPRIREERRMREAQEFTSDITKLVDKMRIKKVDIDPLEYYSHNRRSRSSSVDRKPRKDSHTSRYVYGIGKI